jgi:hypothetical protein
MHLCCAVGQLQAMAKAAHLGDLPVESLSSDRSLCFVSQLGVFAYARNSLPFSLSLLAYYFSTFKYSNAPLNSECLCPSAVR